MSQVGPEFEQNRMDDEIDLVELFLILWKRKWMIVIVTLLFTVAAAGISLVMPKVYAVTAILEPGKDAEGKVVENPEAIRENIIGGSYDREISEKLRIDLDQIPEFKVTVPKNTDLVKITIESTSPDQAVEILNSLITKLTTNIEKKLDVKKQLLINDLMAAQAEKDLYPDQIAQNENLIKATKDKISELESARKKNVLGADNDSMAILLYLNEIQNQQVFLNSLYQRASELKAGEDKTQLKIEELKIKQSSIAGTNINKYPSVPEKPIKPKKTLIVALAFVLGFMGSIMLTFIAEFINKVRQQQAQGE